jgi:hypothetical protein
MAFALILNVLEDMVKTALAHGEHPVPGLPEKYIERVRPQCIHGT